MKKIILLFALVFAGVNVNAQDWVWAKNPVGGIFFYTPCVVTDGVGNVYFAGAYDSPSIQFGNTTIINPDSDGANIFIVKYNPSGDVIWGRTSSGGGGLATAITVDSLGNVYVTGYFNSDSLIFGNFLLTNNTKGTGEFIFIAKYDSDGNALWANGAGGSGFNESLTIATNNNGDVFIAGLFDCPILSLGTVSLKNSTISGALWGQDIFIAKYNSAGTALWARKGYGDGWNQANAVAADDKGNAYITGYFTAPIYFDSIYFNYKNSNRNIFIVKYDASGNIKWANGITDSSSVATANSIAADKNGGVYITGQTQNRKSIFGKDTIIGGFFLAKYDGAGNEQWVRGANGFGVGNCITVDAGNSIYVGGDFFGPSIYLGGITLYNSDPVYSSPLTSEILVAKYDDAGNIISAISAGNKKDQICNSIAASSGGNFYVAGAFDSTALTIGGSVLINPDSTGTTYGIFIARFGFPTGIAEVDKKNELFIYPNPSSNIFHLVTSNLHEANLNIYNTLGETIYQSTITNSNSEIDLSNVAAGIYFLRVQDGGKVYNGKMVKE